MQASPDIAHGTETMSLSSQERILPRILSSAIIAAMMTGVMVTTVKTLTFEYESRRDRLHARFHSALNLTLSSIKDLTLLPHPPLVPGYVSFIVSLFRPLLRLHTLPNVNFFRFN
jgi:hypothetical protein